MKTVGVKQLKARLSEYLRAVKRGEVVVVTERDQVVAELKAPRKDRELSEDVMETLDALALAGELTRAAAGKRGWRWTAKGLGLRPGTAASILEDLRADSVD
ncbi:MAG TPA: type II toxin-antitoxin system prevent-host-death family antitoxin [Gemmatimonadales bacterium]|nr:type II toxin-antitoxin system prevent-host-death family antitoxin [Gemmatimonadales bacterium]